MNFDKGQFTLYITMTNLIYLINIMKYFWSWKELTNFEMLHTHVWAKLSLNISTYFVNNSAEFLRENIQTQINFFTSDVAASYKPASK